MNMPGFGAEAALGPILRLYRGKAVYSGTGVREVLPMLGKTCGACRANSDCRKVDNYGGGCYCLALGPGEAVCENGHCVLR